MFGRQAKSGLEICEEGANNPLYALTVTGCVEDYQWTNFLLSELGRTAEPSRTRQNRRTARGWFPEGGNICRSAERTRKHQRPRFGYMLQRCCNLGATAALLLAVLSLARTAGVPCAPHQRGGGSREYHFPGIPPSCRTRKDVDPRNLRLAGGAGGSSKQDAPSEDESERTDQGDRYDLSFRTRSDASDVRERRESGGERPAAKFSFRRFADQRKSRPEMEGDDEEDDAGESDEATEPSLSVADRLLLQPGGESARELCSGARELMVRGLPGGALELFDRAIAQDNSTHDAWYGRATALLELASVPGRPSPPPQKRRES